MDDMVPERENAFDANEAKTHQATYRLFENVFRNLAYAVLHFFCPRYQLMLNCWNEAAEKRPTFPELVRSFDAMISLVSDKVNASLVKVALVNS